LLSKLNRLEAKNKVPHELFNKMTKKKIDIGDYVLISNELGVIDAVMLSKC